MTVKFTGDWEAFRKATGPGLRRELERNVGRAHQRIGREFIRQAQGLIRAKIYAPNSPITVAIKGSSTPVVADGDLFQALTFETPDPRILRMGVLRRRSGEKIVNVGAIVHEGAVIDLDEHPQVRKAMWARLRKAVDPSRIRSLRPRQRKAVTHAAASIARPPRTTPMTDRQRRAFFAKIRREEGGSPSAAGGGKRIVIPPRRFITTPIKSTEFKRAALGHYEDALRATFRRR